MNLQIAALLLVFTSASSSAVAQGTATQNSPAKPAMMAIPAGLVSQLEKPVVRVNGAVLTERDLRREEQLIFPYAKQHGGNIPAAMEPEIRKGALQMIVFEELVYQESQRRRIPISPEQLAKAREEFRAQFATTAQYQDFLKSEFNGNEQLLREKIRRSLLIERCLNDEVYSRSVVSTAELKNYYANNSPRFQYTESFAVQTISVIPPPHATGAQLQEARKRADSALRQAQATKTAEQFGLLAEKISDDDYRVMMGDHKWVGRNSMPPQMLASALKMQPGEVSGLIEVGEIYVVFRMNRHVPAGKLRFEDVKDNLRKELQQQKIEALRSALNRRLRQKAKIEAL